MFTLPASFPANDYVPFGYIDNPWHTSVLNRSGVLRTVPPMGFGYWCRSMPFGYGHGTRRQVNYLSFLIPSLSIDATPFQRQEDFEREGVQLVSRYHTKNAMTYDWSFQGVSVRLLYHLAGENTLCCLVEMRNTSDTPRNVILHASHLYGYPEIRWWGSDGVASRLHAPTGAAVSKIWAYGDVFSLRMDGAEVSYKATASEEEWRRWLANGDLSINEGAASNSPDPVYSVLSEGRSLAPGETWSALITLTRGVNEVWTVGAGEKARAESAGILAELLAEDDAFYETAPVLEGDWPEDWKCGWIYDLETVRMMMRRPVGIFEHHWDAMQIFTPRAVLGESVIDALCLSYADPELAKDVILGTFADAPMPNVPCTREDGSMNMISMGGEECGTAPIWVLPFRSIRSVYNRDGDDAWVAQLWPHMEAFVQWWLDNRTDETGRFFCNNSWESGQDGSQRFLIEHGEEGKESEYVQTVDVEAAMADAMRVLADLAPAAGRPERAGHWAAMADRRVETTRAMFVDGWFRDFDARTGTPIILPDYMDVMMLLPLSVDIATPDQVESVRMKFDWFLQNPKHWLEWPSFLFCFTEAGWNAGLRQMMADIVAVTATRVYGRTNHPSIVPIESSRATMPEPFKFRIPGTSNEYWPMEPATLPDCGAEAYGWGATLPTLVIRNIMGFREGADGFTLAPTIPATLRTPGARYTMTNLRWRNVRFDLTVEVLSVDMLGVVIALKEGSDPIEVTGADGVRVPDPSRFETANGQEWQGRAVSR